MTDFQPGDRVHLCYPHEGDVQGDPVTFGVPPLVYELTSGPYQVTARDGMWADVKCLTPPSDHVAAVPVIQLIPATD